MPRLQGPAAARGPWYDRNPEQHNLNNGISNYAPHNETERFSYTVPSGSKVNISDLHINLNRATAGSVAGRVYAYIEQELGGSSAHLLGHAVFRTNVVGDGAVVHLGMEHWVDAGDDIAGNTGDAATGGTVDMSLSISGTRFDE